jgi:hypothetical protein
MKLICLTLIIIVSVAIGFAVDSAMAVPCDTIARTCQAVKACYPLIDEVRQVTPEAWQKCPNGHTTAVLYIQVNGQCGDVYARTWGGCPLLTGTAGSARTSTNCDA